MYFYYFLALLAALSWSIASLISTDVSRKLGGIGFNRIRLLIVSLMLISYTFIDDSWQTISLTYLNTIIISGIIGVFIGDTLLFSALQKRFWRTEGPYWNNRRWWGNFIWKFSICTENSSNFTASFLLCMVSQACGFLFGYAIFHRIGNYVTWRKESKVDFGKHIVYIFPDYFTFHGIAECPSTTG